MQKVFFTLIVIIQLIRPPVMADNPLDTILVRSERYLRQTTPLEDVGELLKDLHAHEGWSDIDYDDQQPSGWDASAHLQRLRMMALAWTDTRSPYHQSPSLKNAIDATLGHWLQKRFRNPNWWHNEIGVPRLMQDIIVLLRKDLTSDQFKQSMEVLGQHKVRGTGANLVWSADLGLHYGALAGDVAMVKKCSDLISKEINLTKGEGIQPDYSYHQHGARLQTYHYGGAFLRENIKLAWELRDTPWEFSAEKIDILVNFVLSGWQWMARGIYTVPGTIDRSASRPNALRGADLRSMIPYLLDLKKEKTDELRAVALTQEGKGRPLQGFRHFPHSDFTAYHHPDFSFFVKTISVRTRFSESINGENLKGRLLNSGDAYFLRDGQEYYNLMPVWNWEYLPGITSFPRAQTKQQDFTGGVSNGESGLTVMRHKAESGKGNLSVHKFWAAHKNLIVCLMANTGVSTPDSVYTVLDQCRWRGDVAVNEPANLFREGVHTLKSGRWIHHAGFAYIPLSSSDIMLHLKTARGKWSDINKAGSRETVTERIFMPVLRHQELWVSDGYVVASCETPEDAQSLVRRPEWKVLRNDAQCQSVLFRDGTCMTAFASPTSVGTGSKKELSVDKPCLVLLSGKRLWVTDPTHTGGTVSVRLGNDQSQVILPTDGASVEVKFRQP